MIISRYAGNRELSEENLSQITIDNEHIRNIIKVVERRIN